MYNILRFMKNIVLNPEMDQGYLQKFHVNCMIIFENRCCNSKDQGGLDHYKSKKSLSGSSTYFPLLPSTKVNKEIKRRRSGTTGTRQKDLQRGDTSKQRRNFNHNHLSELI